MNFKKLALATIITMSANSIYAMQKPEIKDQSNCIDGHKFSSAEIKTLVEALEPILAKEFKSKSLNEITDILDAMKNQLNLIEKDARSAKRWSQFLGITTLTITTIIIVAASIAMFKR